MNDAVRTTGIPISRLHDWLPGDLLRAAHLDPPNRAIEGMLGAQSVAQEVLYPPLSQGGGLPVLVRPDNTQMHGDYFEAHILDENGERTATRVKVAKPPDLRQSLFDGKTIRWRSGFEVHYQYSTPVTMRRATRLAEPGVEEESFFEIIWKPYSAVDYLDANRIPVDVFTYPLWALEVGEAVTGVEDVDWLDLNVDARIWVER